jgi:hypothetical protein
MRRKTTSLMVLPVSANNRDKVKKYPKILATTMENGGVDTIVIKSWQHKMGQMANFPPLLASSVFDS